MSDEETNQGEEHSQRATPGGADQGARGTNVPGQLSREQLSGMTAEQIVAARKNGQLDELLGTRRP